MAKEMKKPKLISDFTKDATNAPTITNLFYWLGGLSIVAGIVVPFSSFASDKNPTQLLVSSCISLASGFWLCVIGRTFHYLAEIAAAARMTAANTASGHDPSPAPASLPVEKSKQEFYYWLGGEWRGPVSTEALMALQEGKAISLQTRVTFKGEQDHFAFDELPVRIRARMSGAK